MNINELKYCIEEIYSIRFINETTNLEGSGEEPESIPFPNFVFEFLTNKYLKKPLVDQRSLDLLMSIEFFRNTDEIINIFAKFLNEEFDPDDLEFYLYVRTCLEKEIKVMFIEVARQMTRKAMGDDENVCALNVKQCLNVANSVYGNEQEELLNSFMKKIEEILTEQKAMGIKRNLIETDKILCITLYDYHENKFLTNQNENPEKDNKFGTYENLQKNIGDSNNPEEKVNRLKAIIGTYIKEKELDIFFGKLLTSYSVYEKSKKNIEETMASIKDLVSKKVNLLIRILFDYDEKGWFTSLKLNYDDKDSKEYFLNLTAMIRDMMSIERLQDIPENMVETFGQTLLSTPELNNQINKLVMKRFE